jgi:hypothetical protein
MRRMLTFVLCLVSTGIFAQQKCVRVDSVWSTAKVREMGNRDIKFGIKQMAQDMLSTQYCLSDDGNPVGVEVYYFGIPRRSTRIAGFEKTDQITQVGIKMYLGKNVYQGMGESETEVKAVMVELTGGMPFSKMTVSSAIKKALEECIEKMPK